MISIEPRLTGLPPLAERLSELVDLRIPHFEQTVPEGTVLQRAFRNRPSRAWYEGFRTRVLEAAGREYLPVLRMSDGEFYFLTGYHPPPPRVGSFSPLHYARTYAGALRVGRLPGRFRSGAPKYGWEEFVLAEWWALRRLYAKLCWFIAQHGLLGVNLTVTDPPFSEQYFRPVCDWFDRQAIEVTEANYIPFYFVYALLNGPDAVELLRNRRVLVVSSFDDEKRERLRARVLGMGARDITFRAVSRNKAIKDDVDVSGLEGTIDVALAAAGVGAAKVLWRLRGLNAVCIDAGFCLEVMADPSLGKDRVFCRPDAY